MSRFYQTWLNLCIYHSLNETAHTNSIKARLSDGGVHDSVHRYSDAEHEMEFNSSARADSLLRRVLSKSEMTETFEGRFDYLHYRHVTFLIPDGLCDVQHVPLKVKMKTSGQSWIIFDALRAGDDLMMIWNLSQIGLD